MLSKSTIKYIQSLQHKKFRDEYNVFLAEGPKVISELLQTGIFFCRNIYAVPEWVKGLDEYMQELTEGTIEIIHDYELSKISSFTTANKVVAIFEKKINGNITDVRGKLTLALDAIQDPGNLGTIIRTADWFGIENIICSANTTDMYNPKVVQSTMASLGNVNVFYTDLAAWLTIHKDVKKLATTLDGRSMKEIQDIKEGIIIIGNEARGISPGIIHMADIKISISKYGSAESLNAAVATGIILSKLIDH